LIHHTGATPNTTLYSGEQFDPDLNLYYNRVRYLNVSIGRFWTMDLYEGDPASPPSLHKYIYTADEPVDRLDPSGKDFDLGSLSVNVAISSTIDAISGFRANGVKGAVEGALKGAVIGAVFFGFGALISGGGKLFQFAQASTAAGAVALDSNVLIAALEGGEVQAVDAALAGRVPVISITAAKEFLLKGDVEVLRQFLIARGGSIGTAATAAEIAELQTQATLLGRVLAAADASVAASAIKDAIPLLTRDSRLINFLIAVGQSVETF
jgi:RHS repeat-associated protein